MNSSQNVSGKRERRRFTGQPRAAIVKAHLVDGVPKRPPACMATLKRPRPCAPRCRP
jgi:hypothetical protein